MHPSLEVTIIDRYIDGNCRYSELPEPGWREFIDGIFAICENPKAAPNALQAIRSGIKEQARLAAHIESAPDRQNAATIQRQLAEKTKRSNALIAEFLAPLTSAIAKKREELEAREIKESSAWGFPFGASMPLRILASAEQCFALEMPAFLQTTNPTLATLSDILPSEWQEQLTD